MVSNIHVEGGIHVRQGSFGAIAQTVFAALLVTCLASSSDAQVVHEVVKSFAPPTNGSTPRAALLQAQDGLLYGTTAAGGQFSAGTIFRLDAAGTVTVLHHFAGASDGAAPFAELTQAPDGGFYGTTNAGGTSGHGTVFRFGPSWFGDEWEMTTLHHFTGGTDGNGPYAGLIRATDGNLYGTTIGGGLGYGTIFRITSAGTLTTLHSFTGGSGGWAPIGTLLQAADGALYGTTEIGGTGDSGTIFRLDGAGTFTTLHSFSGVSGGGRPWGALIQGTDGSLYGTTSAGLSGHGTIFKLDGTGTFVTLHAFAGGADGGSPFAGLVQAADGTFYGTTNRDGISNNGTVFKMDAAGVVTTLHRFTGSDGYGPLAALIQAADGRIYGTTYGGGTGGSSTGGVGTIFQLDAAGALATVHVFISGTDGATPYGGLMQAADGKVYGTTYAGGTSGRGTVFTVDSSGTLTTIHNFTGGDDGGGPYSGLIQGADGNLYGTTAEGGPYYGTIFRIDGTGTLTTLHRFTGGIGGWAPLGKLLQAADGSVYGTTQVGGTGDSGTIFKLDAGGTFTTLHHFGGVGGGGRPWGALIQGTDGSIYGTTSAGSTGHGSIFKLDAAGTFTTLHVFPGGANGSSPFGGLVQAADGNFYGTTNRDGISMNGTLFRMDPTGAMTTVHRFTGGDGTGPLGELIQAGDGGFYGTTWGGGANSAGTVFKLDASGVVTTLHHFAGGDGGTNPFWGVIQAADGSFYGTTNAGGTSNAGTVFRLSAPNRAPVADSQSLTTSEDTAVAIVLTASDADGNALTFTVASGPSHGTLTGVAPNLSYTPAAGYTGPDSFTFTASDGMLTSGAATVSIAVAPLPLAVTLTAPNGGEKLFVNVPFTIRWTGAGATAFDLALSRNGGTTYVAIPGCTGLPGTATSCVWTPTAPASTNALIRITARDGGTGTAVDASNAAFAIAGGVPTITVTSPNTAVVWATGFTRAITWNHNLGATSSVRIEVSRDGGTAWEVLSASHPNTGATSGTFAWVVSAPATANARIRVSQVGGPGTDVSNTAFAISAPTIALTAPAATAAWQIGAAHNVTWTHNLGTTESVRIEVSRDNGATWAVVAASVLNTAATSGRFGWTVTGPVSDQARVRVSAVANGAVQAVGTFKIASQISVTAPNTAVTWAAGSRRTITWNHKYGVGQQFDVHFSADGGASWIAMATAVPAATDTTGAYTGPLPATATTQALVRVSPVGFFGDGDVSNVPFTLAAPVITVTAPNTAAVWAIGSNRSIAWTHNLGLAEAVALEVSRDGGATWTSIASSVTNTGNTSGAYSWAVTGPASQTARVRATWVANPTVQDVSNVNFKIQ